MKPIGTITYRHYWVSIACIKHCYSIWSHQPPTPSTGFFGLRLHRSGLYEDNDVNMAPYIFLQRTFSAFANIGTSWVVYRHVCGSDISLWEVDYLLVKTSDLAKKLTPDPIIGEIGDVEIIQYIDTHMDDPVVKRFLSESEKYQEIRKKDHERVLATFNPDHLEVRHEAMWLIRLEYAGMSDDETTDTNWGNTPFSSSSKRDGPPVQIFQMFCYVKDGDDNGDSRHIAEYSGLPTSKQIEDFIKISMACPLGFLKPFIPGTLGFSYNLALHKRSLRSFFDALLRSCNIIFETAQIRDRVQRKDEIAINLVFRERIDMATEAKNAGNDAYARNDRIEALKHYKEAIRQLDKLLKLAITAEEARDKEAASLLAVCWANSSAARMLGIARELRSEADAEGAKQDAENAISADPTYAKGYVRLARAEDVLNNIPGALDALARGLRDKSLQDHLGLADSLIFLQTAGNGFPGDQDEFENLLRNIFEADSASAERMKGIGGAYKRRCKEHMQKLGIN